VRIIIIGAGFAGLKCAKKLVSLKTHEIILFNKTEHTAMLPSLPDVAGGRVNKQFIMEKVVKLVPKNVQVKIEPVTSVVFNEKKVITASGTYDYDLLVMASGAEANYFGFNQNLDKVYKLESVEDAERINRDVLAKAADSSLKNVVISGSGFTGLELGANLHTALKLYPDIAIQFVEKTDTILTPQEPDFAAYVKKELEEVGLIFNMKNTIKTFDGSKVTLESGTELEKAVMIWTSGLKRAVSVTGCTKTLPNGRLIVNADLRLPEFDNVFAIGDCAAFEDNGKILRMAVNYADTMGALAGDNIKRIIKGLSLKSFKPFDPGWILPAHTTSVGYVFGMKISGRIGIPMHFMIIGIKNYSLTNLLAYVGYARKFFFSRKIFRNI
jgi:NADH:ubiquinone reductase (H+-translocating)